MICPQVNWDPSDQPHRKKYIFLVTRVWGNPFLQPSLLKVVQGLPF